MESSSRHHYIPRFLIKNFCDIDNKLWIYNKEKRIIEKLKQSPKSIFFEWGRNTFDINGEDCDNIEKMYADVDCLLSNTLEKILSTQKMTGREQTLIIFLVGLMKWRVPKIDEAFYELAKDTPIEKLGFTIRPIDSRVPIDNDILKKIKEMKIVNETKRLLLPIQPLINEKKLLDIHQNCFIVNDNNYPALLGDCPIIEAPNTSFETLGNFIFPLGTHDTFICKRGAEKNISNQLFYIQKDLAIFHLSKKYVACSDKKQLEKIIEIYDNIESKGSTQFILKYVFEYIV